MLSEEFLPIRKMYTQAIKKIDKGLFPKAFCKIVEDIANDPRISARSCMQTERAPKSSLAYLYWKETGDHKRLEGNRTRCDHHECG